MNVEDTIRTLGELNARGQLSDADFARARAALRAGEPVEERVAEMLLWAEVARLDREWESEREQYKVQFRQARFIPSKGTSVFMGFLMVAAGVVWTIGVSSIKADFGPGFRWWPVYGAMFIAAWLAFCTLAYAQASRYEEASTAHQHRRDRLIADFLGELQQGSKGSQGTTTPATE